jgi:[ribosomal protein S18]-alanine N-acetyltransferase
MKTLHTQFVQKPIKAFGDIFVYTMRKKWLPGILEIESESSENFWGRKDFKQLMKQPSVKGYVAVKLTKVVGFVVYEKTKNHLNMLNLAVSKNYRRRGIGSLLLTRLKNVLNPQRSKLSVTVRESNLTTQLFLKSNEFIATGVLRNYFHDHFETETEIEDAYNFKYTLSKKINFV